MNRYQIGSQPEPQEAKVAMPFCWQRRSFWLMAKAVFYALLPSACVVALTFLTYFAFVQRSILLTGFAIAFGLAIYRMYKPTHCLSDMFFDLSRTYAQLEDQGLARKLRNEEKKEYFIPKII